MIREFKTSDIDEIIRIYTLEYLAMPSEIEALKSASKILVYDDHGIKGFIHLAISGNYCYIEMGAASNEQVKTVGLKLWEEAKKVFAEHSIHFITVFHVKDNVYWEEFYNEIGFNYWYSVYRFSYEGKQFDEPSLNVVKYDDQYFEEKLRLESEAFAVLREENNIEPYNWYLNASKEAIENSRKYTNLDKDYIYLFFDDNEMVGASMVKDAEIDLFFVNVKYQGKGYGKKILEYTINRGLEQNPRGVNLNALASNEKALKIYRNTGFKVVQAQDCRKLILK